MFTKGGEIVIADDYRCANNEITIYHLSALVHTGLARVEERKTYVGGEWNVYKVEVPKSTFAEHVINCPGCLDKYKELCREYAAKHPQCGSAALTAEAGR